jgi:hypothetical protein
MSLCTTGRIGKASKLPNCSCLRWPESQHFRVARDDGRNMRRLVEEGPVGLEQRQLAFLALDLPLNRRKLARGLSDGVLERVDPDEAREARADHDDVEKPDHAAPRILGAPRFVANRPRRGGGAHTMTQGRRPRARVACSLGGGRPDRPCATFDQRRSSTTTCGRWRDRAGPAFSGSKKRLTMRSSSEWKVTTASRPPRVQQPLAREQSLDQFVELGVHRDAQRLKGARRRMRVARLAPDGFSTSRASSVVVRMGVAARAATMVWAMRRDLRSSP